MGRGRKKKLLIIVILLVAVTSLSIGLATFSNVLTISSRATVKPGDGEYKVTIYGLAVDPSTIVALDSEEEMFSKYLSTTSSVSEISGTNAVASPAIIDNNSLTIKNISVTFTSSSYTIAYYYFVLVNEGTSDIFFDSSELLNILLNRRPQVCTAADSTKQAVVDEYCENSIAGMAQVGQITLADTSGLKFTPLNINNIDLEKPYTLASGKSICLCVLIGGNFSDNMTAETGEFYIEFEDISLDFGSTAIYPE